MGAFPITTNRIASVIGAPADNVATSWPALEAALIALGIYSESCAIAVIATVRVECPKFLPQHEYGSEAYLNRLYDTRTDLGNTAELDGDGARYCGRGFVQLTGKANYTAYGKRIGVDLVNNPDRAMDLNIAARVLALYFKDHCMASIDAGDWTGVRRHVNGGTNGLSLFLHTVGNLQAELKTTQQIDPSTLAAPQLPMPPGLL